MTEKPKVVPINHSQDDPEYIVKGSELVQLCSHHIEHAWIMQIEADIRNRPNYTSWLDNSNLNLWFTDPVHVSKNKEENDAYNQILSILSGLPPRERLNVINIMKSHFPKQNRICTGR